MSTAPVPTLYVIPGSHACHAAILMLRHKRVRHRRVNFITLTHPLAVRLAGFSPAAEERTAEGRRTLALRIGDRLGTVPALAYGDERITGNHRIARFLDARHPEAPLVPRDPARRRAVEEVERWADGPLQMDARRVVGAAALEDPAGFARSSANGRTGYLLYRHESVRRIVLPRLLPQAFHVHPARTQEVLDALPVVLDRIDARIAEGAIGGDEPNVADYMVVPSLAVMLHHPRVKPLFEGRPALELVDRLLPDPSA